MSKVVWYQAIVTTVEELDPQALNALLGPGVEVVYHGIISP